MRAGHFRLLFIAAVNLITALSLSAQPVVNDPLPVLIRKAPKAIQDAWYHVDDRIKDNEDLKKAGKPMLPEPFFARAELWAKVGNHEDALSDYLRATELALRADPAPSLEDRSRYLNKLQAALSKTVNTPRPIHHPDAEPHYNAGRQAYLAGDLRRALKHFDNAVQLSPETPVYRLYRALTNKRLRNDRDAEADALTGAALQNNSENKAGLRAQTLKDLERVQGPIRQWLTETVNSLGSLEAPGQNEQ